MTIPNIPGIRSKALAKLRQGKWRPFEAEELIYVASRLGDVIRDEIQSVKDVDGHPLIRMLDQEAEVLGVGVYEWLYAWLSPEHLAMQRDPLLMHELGMKLLNDTWTDDDRKRIVRVQKRMKRQ